MNNILANEGSPVAYYLAWLGVAALLLVGTRRVTDVVRYLFDRLYEYFIQHQHLPS